MCLICSQLCLAGYCCLKPSHLVFSENDYDDDDDDDDDGDIGDVGDGDDDDDG